MQKWKCLLDYDISFDSSFCVDFIGMSLSYGAAVNTRNKKNLLINWTWTATCGRTGRLDNIRGNDNMRGTLSQKWDNKNNPMWIWDNFFNLRGIWIQWLRRWYESCMRTGWKDKHICMDSCLQINPFQEGHCGENSFITHLDSFFSHLINCHLCIQKSGENENPTLVRCMCIIKPIIKKWSIVNFTWIRLLGTLKIRDNKIIKSFALVNLRDLRSCVHPCQKNYELFKLKF